jgi:uncharacterized protein YjiS (DUF1127 family)
MHSQTLPALRSNRSLRFLLKLPGAAVMRLLARLDGWLVRLDQLQERQRQRRALLALDSRLLGDIGISRGEALHEGSKPFWRE